METINARFLYYKDYSRFQSDLSRGKIDPRSIVFIEGPNIIWTHNHEFPCNGVTDGLKMYAATVIKTEVTDGIATIPMLSHYIKNDELVIPETPTDLTDYLKKDELSDYVQDVDLLNYATIQYVDQEIIANRIQLPPIDSQLDSTSTNAVENRAIYAALNTYLSKDEADRIYSELVQLITSLKRIWVVGDRLPIVLCGEGSAQIINNIEIDSLLSASSENAVQNKAVANALNSLQDTVDTLQLGKQDVLTAGNGIQINLNTGVISSTIDTSSFESKLDSLSKYDELLSLINNKEDKDWVVGDPLPIVLCTNQSSAIDIVIDSQLSASSENAVQNKTITQELSNKITRQEFDSTLLLYQEKIDNLSEYATKDFVSNEISRNKQNLVLISSSDYNLLVENNMTQENVFYFVYESDWTINDALPIVIGADDSNYSNNTFPITLV